MSLSVSARSLGRSLGRTTACGLVAALALLSGCADRHSIEVGSIPDDYRTRHPIIVGEADETLEIPVASSESRLPQASRERIATFSTRFLRSGAVAMRVLVPRGSENSAAAELAMRDVGAELRQAGIPRERILTQGYPAAGVRGPSPIRFAYSTLTASTDRCGRWPDDLADTSENKNYANFGCASQQNFAAQIADPRDLLGPRGIGEIDAERRTNMLDKYRKGQTTGSAKTSTESNYSW